MLDVSRSCPITLVECRVNNGFFTRCLPPADCLLLPLRSQEAVLITNLEAPGSGQDSARRPVDFAGSHNAA